MSAGLASLLEEDTAAISALVVERMRVRHPHLFERYGESGKIRCIEDTQHHVRHLAAALAIEDPSEFARYRSWLTRLLVPRGIPEEDIELNLAVLAEVLSERFGDSAARAVRFIEGSAPLDPSRDDRAELG